MAYDYQSRQKLVEAYRAKWKRKLLLVPGEIKEAAEEMEKFGGYRQDTLTFLKTAQERLKQGNFSTPSEFMKAYYRKLVRLFAGKQFEEDFYQPVSLFPQHIPQDGADKILFSQPGTGIPAFVCLPDYGFL